MELSLETAARDDWLVMTIGGELDLYTVTPLKEALSAAIAKGSSRIALDLSGVGFMDSSSLGVLVVALKRARERGGTIALVGVEGSPAKVLALTGLDSAFELLPSLDALGPA